LTSAWAKRPHVLCFAPSGDSLDSFDIGNSFGCGKFGSCPFLFAGLADFLQPGGLADAVSQEVEFGSAGLASADNLDIGDLRAVQREDALDALVVDDPPNGESFVDARAASASGRLAQAVFYTFPTISQPGAAVLHFSRYDYSSISGRRCCVRSWACSSRQAAIFAWSPFNSTSGTAMPRKSLGLV